MIIEIIEIEFQQKGLEKRKLNFTFKALILFFYKIIQI